MPPSVLKTNDKVAIVSTARKISEEELKFAIDTLKNWGLRVVLGKTIGLSDNQFAGTDAERVLDFQTMLDDDRIKAVICARGGYGTVRMIDKIDFTRFKNKPKWVVGYSDVTVLHNHIAQFNIPTIHATMPVNFENNTVEALNSLKSALFGADLSHSFAPHPFNKQGVTKGKLIGGNLSIIYSLIGSHSDINTDGKILFLEDLDEYLYHIDRMIQNLKRSGKLANLSGLVIGAMSSMNDNPIPFGKTANEIIKEAVSAYDYPVCFNAPIGHINDNRAVVLNDCQLQIGTSDVRLSFS